MLNDVETNHFTFKVSGLGSKSSANVTINEGEYWLAVDGQYLVKYSLITETVVDPETDVMHMEVSFEVQDINQLIEITFPQGYLDAKAASLVTFDGTWETDFGDMTCAVDYNGNATCTYAQNDGRIEGYLNLDGLSMEGEWSDAPSYAPPITVGRCI